MGLLEDVNQLSEDVEKVNSTVNRATRAVQSTDNTVKGASKAAKTGADLLSNPAFWIIGFVLLYLFVMLYAGSSSYADLPPK